MKSLALMTGLGLVLFACAPSPEDGQLRCNPFGKACPDGYYCATSLGSCWRTGHGPGAVDGGAGDMPIQLGDMPLPDGSPSSYTLTVMVSGSASGHVDGVPGLLCGTPTSMGTMCAVQVAAGGNLTLVETPDPNNGSVFGGWGGACAGSASMTTCTLSMNGDKTVTAKFSFVHTLSVTLQKGPMCGTATSSDAYVSTSVTGLSPMNCADCGSGKFCSAQFLDDTQLTLTITPGLPVPNSTSCSAPQGGVPTIGPISGSCTISTTNSTSQLSCVLTMDSDKFITVDTCQQAG